MKILLADDDVITLRLLENTVKRLNHDVLLAHDGSEAWQIIRKQQPEIVLLDWMMPGLDGLEICRRLRDQFKNHFSYVILLTANDRTEDITAGLDAGANDYITKPFDHEELKSRISVGVRVVTYESRLQTMNEELRRYSQQMESLAQERARQLVQADRMVTLGTMAAGIAHEINNPLTILQGNVKLFKKFWQEEFGPAFAEVEQQHVFPISSKSVQDLIGGLETAVVRVRNIIDGMRKFSHGQGGEVETLNLESCLKDSLEICLPKTKNKLEIRHELEKLPFPVKGNPVQITQVLVNLISNAADALAGTPKAQIMVTLRAKDRTAQFLVTDNGPGIPSENHDKLWSPFFTTKPVGQGTGLGLFICHSIMEEHGGSITVASQVGQGTTFTLTFPCQEDFERFLAEKEPEKNPVS